MDVVEDSRNVRQIPMFKPCHPQMVFYEDRLQTFDTWPKQMDTTKYKLAEAGFIYTGMSDRVKCAFCDLLLGEWSKGDVPLEEHHRHGKGCIFLKMIGYGEKEDSFFEITKEGFRLKTNATFLPPAFQTPKEYGSKPNGHLF